MTHQVPKHSQPHPVGFLNRMPPVDLPAAPPVRVRQLVFWLFLLGACFFGGIGSYAALVPMKSAIVAPGVFKADGDRLVVQHLEGGIVREILVEEGDLVDEGQVIARLDDVRARAQLGVLRAQMVNAVAQNLRLRAEHSGEEALDVSDDLAALLEKDDSMREVLAAQQQALAANREVEQGQVEILHRRKAQLAEQLVGTRTLLEALDIQLSVIKEEREDLEKLFAQGLIPKGRYVARRSAEAEILGDIGTAKGQEQDILQRIAEIEGRILQVRRDRLTEIAAERQQVQERIFDLRERLNATRDVLNRLTIQAPKAGRIVGLDINTLGEVIDPGQKILELVPKDTPFLIESRVSPNDIDEVIPDGPARIRLTAFSFRDTPPVDGRVSHISADSFVDPVSGTPYYRVDVEIRDGALEALDGIVVQAGMPAQVMLTTGEQTLAEYILNPVLGGLETALVEK